LNSILRDDFATSLASLVVIGTGYLYAELSAKKLHFVLK
jgi:hypothetical protein